MIRTCTCMALSVWSLEREEPPQGSNDTFLKFRVRYTSFLDNVPSTNNADGVGGIHSKVATIKLAVSTALRRVEWDSVTWVGIRERACSLLPVTVACLNPIGDRTSCPSGFSTYLPWRTR